MKITGGEKKGTSLKVPKRGTRPPTGMIRSSIFNILGKRVSNSNILDLFAGSGSFSIEALSRGAKDTVMIDNLREAIGCIRENLMKTNFSEMAEILMMDFFKGIKLLQKRNKVFDIVFIDPPFEFPLKKLMFAFQLLPTLLTEDGIIVLRLKKRVKFVGYKGFEVFSKKTYGDSEVYLLRKV